MGVIGCGRIAHRHVDAYRHLGIEVVVVDQNPDAARLMAASHEIEHRPGVEYLLDAKDIDAIDVCVPTSAHASAVIAALESGKHVFCEKPLCTTLEEGAMIQAAQRSSGRVLMVGYLYRFHPAFQLARQVLQEAIIGKPHMGIFRLGGRGATSAWKHNAGAGGGAGLEIMVHLLDLVCWLLGPAERMEILARKTLLPRRKIDGAVVEATAEDYVLTQIGYPDMEVICQGDLVTPSYMNYVEVHGDNGSLFASILSHLPTIVYCTEARGVFNLGNNIQQFPPVNLFEAELGYFVRAVRQEVEPVSGLRDSLDVLALLNPLLEVPVNV
ncbi:MAG TPA: Gfo/Idh/MocA family oxidoreductase [Candidatus Dormibacteraeota bacterium]|nr:Gfo/Idh/MocA family oxidoreductase [Candidatus Dormibacteraeota bacterium]